MRSTGLIHLLVLGLSAISAVEAVMTDGRVAMQNGAAVQKRQTDDPDTTTPTQSSSPPPNTPSSTTSRSVSPTSTTRSSTTSSRTTPSSTSITTPTSTSNTRPTDSPSDSGSIITTTITTTDGNGVPTTLTTQSTSTPTLANNGGGGPSGMSPQTKNTVIGVVVGVGGAIVLGGLAFVAWRIWGRKKHNEERDELMEYPSSAGEKPDTGNSLNNRTPFQSTLESYHAPTQVNTASNF